MGLIKSSALLLLQELVLNQFGLHDNHKPSLRGIMERTHHFKVLRSALGAVEVAGQQHVVDVVAGAVVELPHVKGSRLEVVEIRFDLKALQNALLHQMYVPDLVPAGEEGPVRISHSCTHFSGSTKRNSASFFVNVCGEMETVEIC